MILYEGNEQMIKQQLICDHYWGKKYRKDSCDYVKCYRCGCVNIFTSSLPQELIGNTTYPDCANCKRVEEALKKAYYDVLTKLPNRFLFNDRLERAVLESQRYNRSFALIFIDLDNFKQVNDSLGHHIGDMLLQEVSNRLLESLRDSDSIARNISTKDTAKSLNTSTVVRMGGDEFTIILNSLRDMFEASTIVERILVELNKPFWFNNQEVKISASIGISLYPSHNSEAEDLLIKADQAMYYIKRNGGNGFSFYNKSKDYSK